MVAKALSIFQSCTAHKFLQHSDTVGFGLKGIGQKYKEVFPWGLNNVIVKVNI